jgi:hypothetical protein
MRDRIYETLYLGKEDYTCQTCHQSEEHDKFNKGFRHFDLLGSSAPPLAHDKGQAPDTNAPTYE